MNTIKTQNTRQANLPFSPEQEVNGNGEPVWVEFSNEALKDLDASERATHEGIIKSKSVHYPMLEIGDTINFQFVPSKEPVAIYEDLYTIRLNTLLKAYVLYVADNLPSLYEKLHAEQGHQSPEHQEGEFMADETIRQQAVNELFIIFMIQAENSSFQDLLPVLEKTLRNG